MIYELTLQAVKTKLDLFNPPAKIINSKELTCAIGIAYQQAGLALPDVAENTMIQGLIEKCFHDIPSMDEKLKTMISEFVIPHNEMITNDSMITLKLGYEKGA